MSYAIRNSIILFVFLLILVGLGWGWLKFTYGSSLEVLDANMKKKEVRLKQLETILADYDYMQENLNQTLRRWEYYPKALLPENTIQETFRYLESIGSQRASFDYEFRLSGTEKEGQVIFANYQLKGNGRYRNINRFVQLLEYSKPLYKIESVQLSRPAGGQGAGSEVDITLKFKGIFVPGNNMELLRDVDPFDLGEVNFSTGYDPFRPVILGNLPPNVDNLLVVERAKVIAILKGLAYIQDQSGNMLTMREGDRVYLGIIEKINLRKSEVIFAMNRGGISDRVVLRLDN